MIKKGSIVKFTCVTILAIAASILGFCSPSFNSQVVSGLVTFVSIIVAYVQYCYSNQNEFFLFMNVMWQRAKNPKSDWQQTIELKFHNDEYDDDLLNKFTNEFITKMKKEGHKIIRTDGLNSSSTSFTIFNPGPHQGELSLSKIGDDEFQLTMSYSKSVSFKEFRTALKELKNTDNIMQSILPKVSQNNGHKIQVKLYFESGNPFYGYILREVSPKAVTDFQLRFNAAKSAMVSASKHYIQVDLQIDNNSFDDLENVLKGLVVVPNLY
ncbi:hypothetical protein [Lacticaseibacillus paracasei]|uniref:hypothetical protein n=1 Tax=Lacticaseibacillus paracasei TaxID=1597 RepID=UPI0031D3478B